MFMIYLCSTYFVGMWSHSMSDDRLIVCSQLLNIWEAFSLKSLSQKFGLIWFDDILLLQIKEHLFENNLNNEMSKAKTKLFWLPLNCLVRKLYIGYTPNNSPNIPPRLVLSSVISCSRLICGNTQFRDKMRLGNFNKKLYQLTKSLKFWSFWNKHFLKKSLTALHFCKSFIELYYPWAGNLKGLLRVKPWFSETPFQRLCTKKHLNRQFLTIYLKANISVFPK